MLKKEYEENNKSVHRRSFRAVIRNFDRLFFHGPREQIGKQKSKEVRGQIERKKVVVSTTVKFEGTF